MIAGYFGIATLGLALAAAPQDKWERTEGWYTPHHDAMRTGRTHYSPGKPFRYVWHRKYWEEMISPETEPIVAEGLVFFGTWGGTFRALDALTGGEVWKTDAPGGVRHSATYDGGRIYFATIGDREGGSVLCREARTGKKVWEFRPGTRGGFATSPAVYRRKVYIGGRDKVLYCLDAGTGEKIWAYEAGGVYLQTCAAKDGKVVVAAEDMIPRCFDADSGRLIWEAEQMQSDSCRFYYPVFWRDTVIFRTCAPDTEISRPVGAVIARSEDGKARAAVHKKHGWSKAYFDWNSRRYKLFTPEKYRAEQEAMQRAIRDGQLLQTFYMLDVSDGSEKMVTAVTYAASENGHSTPTPPPVDFNGNLYVLFRSFYTQYEYPIRSDDCIGTLDYGTGLPEMLPKEPPGYRSFFPITADEVNNFTVGGEKLYCTHDHCFAYYDMKTKRVEGGYAVKTRSETWGGLYLCGPGEMGKHEWFNIQESPNAQMRTNNEWNGTSRGAVAIYKDRVWWITGNMIICLEGKGGAR